MSLFGGFQGTSNWEADPEHTREYVLSDQGTLWETLGPLVEGGLGYLAWLAAIEIPDPDNRSNIK